MFRRLLLTISTTACLSAIYAIYALTVTPLFTPEQIEAPEAERRPTQRVVKDSPIYEQLAAKWLGQHPWTTNARYKVGSSRAYLYAEDWDKVEPSGDVRFRPFAMIYLSEKPGEQPLVVVAESALLQFATPFDEMNPKPGRVVGGALEGSVEIDGAKGLTIRTRNVNFSEGALRVWSDEPIEFRVGQNHGKGLGLEMDLLPGPPSNDMPAVSGLRALRIRKDVVLNLQSKPRGDEGKVERAMIRSAGNFEYQLAERMAWFRDNVHLDHPTKEGQVDTLDCRELFVVFEPKAKPAGDVPAGGAAANASDSDDMGDLDFRRMRAIGDSAAGAPVKLVSTRAELVALASEVTYDAQLRVATLKDGRQVKVTQKLNDLYSPEVTIVHEEKGGRIIEALCRGAGRVESYKADPAKPGTRGALAFSGNWLTQLHKYPDKETGLDLIELEGQAGLTQPGQLTLGGELIKIWITPEKPKSEKPKAEPGQAEVAGAAGAREADDSRTAQVQRVEAHRKVTFHGDKLTGKSERLVITIEAGTLPIPRPGGVAQAEAPKTSAVVPVRPADKGMASRRVERGFAYVDDPGPVRKAVANPEASRGVKPVAAGAGTSSTRKGQVPAAAKVKGPPLDVSANLITVKMIRDGDETDAAEVETEGAVRVVQPRVKAGAPLVVEGDWMRLWNYANDEQVVHVIGKPAAVLDPQMELRGENLHLDRGANSARVEGSGTLKLPMTKGMDGKVLTKPQWLTVNWRKRMTFDGLLARFEMDVSSVLDENRMNSHEMDVTFTKRVSFLEGNSPVEPAAAVSPGGSSGGAGGVEVDRIHCKDGVDLFAYEYDADRKLKAFRTGSVFEFELHQKTGETTAMGPGKMRMWWRGDAARETLSSTASVRANRSQKTDRAEWNFARVEFAGTMTGNTKERVTLFRERVRVLYGPVASTAEQIDVDHLPVGAGWLRSDTLRLVQVAGPGGRDFIEMVGQGNAELSGKTANGLFDAMADIVTYDESKGVYVLRSEGNRKASIWRQVSLGSPRSHIGGSSLVFNPTTYSVKADRVTGLDGIE